MTTIHFIKIKKYQLQPLLPEGEFEYISKVLNQTHDPSSLEPKSLKCVESIILHSPLKRCLECMDYSTSAQAIEMSELREIPFDIKGKITEEEWEEKRSDAVREAFVNSFIEDTLMISRKDLKAEIEKVLSMCKKMAKTKNIEVISHSFRLKVIEAYIKTNGRVFNNVQLIREFVPLKQKTYEFGEGFDIKSSDIILSHTPPQKQYP